MTQLGQLLDQYGEFTRRDKVVIAVSQEDKDLKSHGKIHQSLKGDVPFEIVADIGRKQTSMYKRTTAYFIDKSGTVREVFPMIIHARPSWSAILARMDELTQ